MFNFEDYAENVRKKINSLIPNILHHFLTDFKLIESLVTL